MKETIRTHRIADAATPRHCSGDPPPKIRRNIPALRRIDLSRERIETLAHGLRMAPRVGRALVRVLVDGQQQREAAKAEGIKHESQVSRAIGILRDALTQGDTCEACGAPLADNTNNTEAGATDARNTIEDRSEPETVFRAGGAAGGGLPMRSGLAAA